MSRNSKAKRDQRKKLQPRRPFARLGREVPVTNHAVLRDGDGQVVAAIGLQSPGEWLLAIGGQTMGSAEDPVPMLAMLQHLANVQNQDGKALTLEYSDTLTRLLAAAAEDAGRGAEEHLAALVAEFEQEQAAADTDTDTDTDTDDDADADADADATAGDGEASAPDAGDAAHDPAAPDRG
ncbi:hypothetical protein [Xanthomonas massiliensis]|uniref:hypothetical protein n=1 Tax=Xanthomonas massiliensis TaxID=1720302 RepID=UPI0008243A31|nr:hypothetical protein [Xanthomonas massiliensis]